MADFLLFRAHDLLPQCGTSYGSKTWSPHLVMWAGGRVGGTLEIFISVLVVDETYIASTVKNLFKTRKSTRKRAKISSVTEKKSTR